MSQQISYIRISYKSKLLLRFKSYKRSAFVQISVSKSKIALLIPYITLSQMKYGSVVLLFLSIILAFYKDIFNVTVINDLVQFI